MAPSSKLERDIIDYRNSLAYLEMRLILAKILWNFDLSLEEESKHWTSQRLHLVWRKGPLMVKLTPVGKAGKVKSG